jgi:hypothetical protein
VVAVQLTLQVAVAQADFVAQLVLQAVVEHLKHHYLLQQQITQ